MNLMLSFARSMMRLAGKIAPSSKDSWKAAMQSEFAQIEDGGEALSWSAGCLTAALGWRLVSEASFVAAIILASATAYFAFLILFWTTDFSAAGAAFPMAGRQAVCVALACLVCSLVWPGRALLIAALVTLSYGGGQFIQFHLVQVLAPREAYAGYHDVSAWSGVLVALAIEICPGALGSLVGAAMGWAWRRRVRLPVA